VERLTPEPYQVIRGGDFLKEFAEPAPPDQ
jgi:hypothetical protein